MSKNKSANNFNLLRLVAAYMVLYWHAYALYPDAMGKPNYFGQMSLGAVAVYVFFSISGYLIYKSWLADPNIWRYLLRRSLRIFPALFVVIVISAIILGPLVGDLPIGSYYSSYGILQYLKNIGLYPVYLLPGVFSTNHYPSAVNGSIWSLPIEFFMYLVLLTAGVIFREGLKWGLLILLILFILSYYLFANTGAIVFYGVDLRQIPPNGIFFIVGAIIAAFNLEKYLTLSGSFLAITVFIVVSNGIATQMLSWVVVPYLSLAFGLQSSWLAERMKSIGDYSYGIYIYAFPVQQTTTYFFPQIPFIAHVCLDALITLIFSIVSWHYVEAVALKYKPQKPITLQSPSTGFKK